MTREISDSFLDWRILASWVSPPPEYRKANARPKQALLISSAAAPGFIARFAFNTLTRLQTTAKVIGAKPMGTLFVGMVAQQPEPQLSAGTVNKIKTKAALLAKRLKQ